MDMTTWEWITAVVATWIGANLGLYLLASLACLLTGRRGDEPSRRDAVEA